MNDPRWDNACIIKDRILMMKPAGRVGVWYINRNRVHLIKDTSTQFSKWLHEQPETLIGVYDADTKIETIVGDMEAKGWL